MDDPRLGDGPVVVVGGGLVGLSCAWFLRAAGAEVTLLEAGRPGGGASRGNAGAICPSMTEPLPAPGMIREALADITRSDAALHVHPAYAPRMAGFLRRFAAAATPARYERGLAAMAQLGRGVTAAYDELAASGIGTGARADGYLFVHASAEHAARERAQIARMSALGLCAEPTEMVAGAALRDLEPMLGPGAVAGFLVPGERWIDPGVFVDELAAGCQAVGVEVVTDASASRIQAFDDGVEVETAAGRFDAATAVVAAGVWTRDLVAPLGVRLPILPGKGYSFAVRSAPQARRAMHLSDAHVMAVPMGERLRVAGTMEFDGSVDRFHARRIEAIARATAPFLDVDLGARAEEWVGPRPITPDGLPFLGVVPGHARVVVAAGHNMIGLTLAPVTGRAIAGLVTAGDAGIDLAPFALDRR
jgi:D-amino-acid dehydrogenase